MKLTRIERWMLSNQFAILAKLYPDGADGYQLMRDVVEHGYELHYDWILPHIYDGEDIMTSKECKEILDILDMFRALKDSYQALSDKSAIETHWTAFRGFDGNTEAKQI